MRNQHLFSIVDYRLKTGCFIYACMDFLKFYEELVFICLCFIVLLAMECFLHFTCFFYLRSGLLRWR